MNRRALLLITLVAALNGCATFPGSADSPAVRVVGLEPLPSEGLEVRFELKLRVQNPNDITLAYDGLSVSLDIAGRGLASGVSNVTGEIPRFSEELLSLPVSISAFSFIRQLWVFAQDGTDDDAFTRDPIAYKLTGKLGAPEGKLRAVRFSDSGELDLFSSSQNTAQ